MIVLFSRRLDVLAFVVPTLVSLVLVAIGVPLGLAEGALPEWTWLACIVAVDVAHVWGNLVLVYFDPVERRRRPLLYFGMPLAALAIAIALASESQLIFWRALAALAVIHFVRQQVGWVKLYRGKAKEGGGSRCLAAPFAGGWARVIDEGAIYAATFGPIIWWHANLPRPFWWIAEGDFFVALPNVVGDIALALEAFVLVVYVVKAIVERNRNVMKHVIVATTVLMWWLGIVAFASDYVFTVTNVLIHGVPYAILIVVTARRRKAAGRSLARPLRYGALAIVATLIVLALAEELLWDRLVSGERDWLFPIASIDTTSWQVLLVPLLAWPQLTHYLLDAFLWRRRDNPHL